MAAQSLDHVNVFTDDLEGTIAFYTDILGLKDGERPPFDFPGAWLYCGDQAVVHLVGEPPAGSRTGPIDHVAFRASGIESMRARLRQHALDFFERDVPDMPLRQIFVNDPNGVKIELNFWNET